MLGNREVGDDQLGCVLGIAGALAAAPWGRSRLALLPRLMLPYAILGLLAEGSATLAEDRATAQATAKVPIPTRGVSASPFTAGPRASPRNAPIDWAKLTLDKKAAAIRPKVAKQVVGPQRSQVLKDVNQNHRGYIA